jgi:hypothetical protein
MFKRIKRWIVDVADVIKMDEDDDRRTAEVAEDTDALAEVASWSHEPRAQVGAVVPSAEALAEIQQPPPSHPVPGPAKRLRLDRVIRARRVVRMPGATPAAPQPRPDLIATLRVREAWLCAIAGAMDSLVGDTERYIASLRSQESLL